MSRRGLNQEDYMSLLEQAVMSGPVPSGPKGQRTSKAPIPPDGVKYRGITLGGDKILDWEGEDDDSQHTHYDTKDVKDIVKKVAGIDKDKVDDLSSDEDLEENDMSLTEIDMLLEDDDEDGDSEDGVYEEDGTKAGTEGHPDNALIDDDELEDAESDVEVNENLNFTNKESEILGRLIQEMSLLEDTVSDELNEEDDEESDDDEDDDDKPDLDIDDDDDD